MLRIYQGPLPCNEIYDSWQQIANENNCGAFITFTGIVREEGGIEGLSFDIYEPILSSWFESWQQKAKEKNATVLMAHSLGDVPINQSSYMAAIISPKRRVALEMIDIFVEDFKANAPIWKYDLIEGKRIYAKERSKPMEGSGLLK